MKMSDLVDRSWRQVLHDRRVGNAQADDILVPDVLEQLQLAIGALRQDGRRKGLHDLVTSSERLLGRQK